MVPEENVGGIIADLNGRFAGISVGVIEDVPFDRNKPKVVRKTKVKKKGTKWSRARRAKHKRKQLQRKQEKE